MMSSFSEFILKQKSIMIADLFGNGKPEPRTI